MKTAIALIVLCAIIAVVSADRLKLRQMTVLNRHGHRAPNGPYWRMCPKDKYNKRNYDVAPQDLTGLGFKQEFIFGQFLRQNYGDFIGEKYDHRQQYCRAVGEPRTMQSAEAIMQGLFPAGFGPKGFQPSKPQVVPVFADLEPHEYLLDAIPCRKEMINDKNEWFKKFGTAMLAEATNNKTMERLMKMCDTPMKIVEKKGWDMFVKLVVDGVIFNHDYGLDVLHGQIDKDMMFNLRNISIQMLLGKLYGTDQEKTYMVVDFPDNFLTKFEQIANGTAKASTKLDVFVGHREELYGFGEFFGFGYRVSTYPVGELPVSSTIMLELLEDTSEKKPKFYVKVWLWTPYNGKYTLPVPGCKNPHLCTLEELRAVYNKRVERTGTWDKLCKYHGPMN